MDDHFIAVGGDEHNDLEKIRSPVRADDQPPVRVLAQVVDSHGVFDGMEDVVVSDAVAASRRVNLHTALV